MEYLYLGIIIGLVINHYIFPFLDLMQERITYSVTVGATRKQIQAQKIVANFNREYPEVEGSEQTQAIGFNIDDCIDDEEEDFDEDEIDDKVKNKIGY